MWTVQAGLVISTVTVLTVYCADSFNYLFLVDPSQTKASTVNGEKDTVLSSAVSGELLSSVTCEECTCESSDLISLQTTQSIWNSLEIM